MRVVAIIQARLGSTRLPGKALADIHGKSMLARVVERIGRCERVDRIVVACPEADAEAIRPHTAGATLYPHPGDPTDVLSRYAAAARMAEADVVVRITSDCPLIDPEVCDAVIERLIAASHDYASNAATHRTYPKGLDCEAMTTAALMKAHELATDPADREHVTRFIYQTRPDLFRIAEVRDTEADNSDLRWTVDTAEDLAYVRWLYDILPMATEPIGYRALVAREREARRLAGTI